MDGGDSDEGSPGGCAKAALATAKRRGVTEAGFLYSDKRLTAEKEAVRFQLRRWGEGKRCSCNHATGRRPRGW